MPIRRAASTLLLLAASTALSTQPRPAAQEMLVPAAVCTPQTLGPAVVDVPSVAINPRFLLNGRPFPGPESGLAVFTLWASDPSDFHDGPQLILGESNLPSQTVRVVPGVYDVYYSWVAGTGVPRNELTRVMHRVTLDANRALAINVPMISIGGLKQHNGHAFGFDGSATLSLRGLDWPGVVPLGAVQPAEFETRIIPGRYAVEYDWQQGVNFPNNRDAVIRRLDLSAAVDDLRLNVRSVVQSFQFLHNGGAFPASLINHGNLVLRRGDRDEVVIGSSHESPTALRVIPGSYDVYWRHVAGAGVPANTNARVQRGLVVKGGVRVIDVPSLEVSGTFLVNGVPPPSSEVENAQIRLGGRGTDDTLILGQTRYGAYEKRVVPGVYDIVYEHLVGASTLPVNPRATLARGWRVEDSPERTIDIPAGTYSGTFQWNGGDFPSSIVVRADVYAVPTAADADPVLLGRTHYGAFTRPLLPGRYGAAYSRVAGPTLPANTFTAFGPTRRVRDMEGRFNLYYEYRGGPDLPVNAFMPFGCWTLTR